jgi:iron complex outermembrane receptor protein
MLTAGVSLLASTTGYAQTNEPAEELTEILVTAERRSVSLQQAPMSVSAITADALQASNITDITGLNGSVPGLVVARSGGGERILSIRGIGSETPENTNTQPGVSYHIDGVYIFNSIAASAAFIDVGQVEVLRGPQGTLFGQGSTGGTINVVSSDPSTESLSGVASIGASNYNGREASGSLNVPVSDTIALRGAIQRATHDGYTEATGVPGFGRYELDDADDLSWRLGGKWSPAEAFSVTLNTIQYRSDTHGPAQKNILDPEPDPRLVTQDYTGRSYVNTELYTGVVRWDTGPVTIKSISSYQKLRSEQSWDADGLTADLFFDLTFSPVSFVGSRYDHVALWQSDTESWTQELNLSSNGDGPFSWILGGVYLHSENQQYIVEYRASDDNILRPALPVDTPFDSPEIATLTYAELSSITREPWAIYAQATQELSSQLKLTGGLRYNHDRAFGAFSNAAGGSTDATSGTYLQPAPTDARKANQVTGKVALEYQLATRNMVYASYTRGFKPGGINSSAASNNSAFGIFGWTDAIKPTYEEETVDSFEIGTKNRFFDGTLQLNASTFLYNYENMQFLEEDPVLFGEGISNAPKARVYGVEVEGNWAATRHLRLDGSLSWLQGEFTEDYFALDPGAANAAQTAAGFPDYLFWMNFFDASVARDAARRNINGNSVPKLPRWQGNLALTYSNEIGSGMLTARAQYIYRGDYQYRLFNDGAIDKTPSYDQMNLMLSYGFRNTGADVTLRVTNLFDDDGINSRFSDPYGSAQVMETYIPPRQVSVLLGYKF